MVLRCFVTALAADSGMILGRSRSGKVELLSAAGNAARHATVPWTKGSFLGQSMLTGGVSLEPASGFRDGPEASETWHAVACRIEGPHGPVGAVYAGFERASSLGRGELTWAAESHARLAGLCMSDEGELVAEVLRSSGVDHLTGCLYPERVMEALAAEVHRSTRQGHELSCCFFDLDHFKAINDEHGHATGNRVLALTGESLIKSARAFDSVGRFGGDEFVIVMPETSLADARRAAARMRRAVSSTVESVTGLQVTASVGVAQWKRGSSALRVLESADRALQEDKAIGDTHGGPSSAPRANGLAALVSAARERVLHQPGRKGSDR